MRPRRMSFLKLLIVFVSAQISASNLVSPALQGFGPSVAFQFAELSRMIRMFGLSPSGGLPVKMSMSSARADAQPSESAAAASARRAKVPARKERGRADLI